MNGNLYIYQIKGLEIQGVSYNNDTQRHESVFKENKLTIENISQEKFSDMFLIRNKDFYDKVKEDVMQKGHLYKKVNGGTAKFYVININGYKNPNKNYYFIFGFNTNINDIRELYNTCKKNRNFDVFKGEHRYIEELRKEYSDKKIRQFGIINGAIKEMKPIYTEQELRERGERIYSSRDDIRYIIEKDYVLNHIDQNNNIREYRVPFLVCGLNLDKNKFIEIFKKIKDNIERNKRTKHQDESGKFVFEVWYDGRNEINGKDDELKETFKTRREAELYIQSKNKGQLENRYHIEPVQVKK